MNLRLLLILLMNYCLYSQTISGLIVDGESKKAIKLANVSLLNSGLVVSAGEDGKFEIKINDPKDKLLVSALGYETKIIDLNSFNKNTVYIGGIYLFPKYEELENVVVYNKKIEYTTLKLQPQKAVTFKKNYLDHGECILIRNTVGKKGKLKEVVLDFEAVFGKRNLNRLTNFRVTFYEYNKTKALPGREISFSDAMIATQSKVRKLIFNLDHLDIPFPENGLCMSVIAVNRNVETENITVLNSSNVQYKSTASLFEYSGKLEDFMIPNWTSNLNYIDEWTNEKLQLLSNDLLRLNLILNIKVKIEK